MSDVPDSLDFIDGTETESAGGAADKKIVFGARKPTEEASPLTGIPLIIEAPFPCERTLQWWPCESFPEEKLDANNVSVAENTAETTGGLNATGEPNGEPNQKPANASCTPDANGNTAVVVSQEVLIKVNEHVSQSLDRELGGFLLGNRYRCPNTPCDYVIIDQFSPAKFTESTEVRLAFTHEAWAQLSDELTGKFLGKLLIGWYHSHPRMDVFLSSHDMEIQNERFPEPWMVALVLEPEKHHGGFFCARDGRVKPNSPVDFFELLERNSRTSVLAWENYKALDPATSSIPILNTSNTASLTRSSSPELMEARSKQEERVPSKPKRGGRLLAALAILAVLLGAVAIGVKNRKRVGSWLQSKTEAIPAVPSPSVAPAATQEPTVAPVVIEPKAAPEPTPSPTPSPTLLPSPVQQPSRVGQEKSQHESMDRAVSPSHSQSKTRRTAERRNAVKLVRRR
jgi:proteasome lid subunit RPN8/RPN11